MDEFAEYKQINILIVEDSEDDLYFIKKALSDKRYNVKILTAGIEAYNYLLNPEIDPEIILLDYMLPGMNGIELLEKINEQENTFSFIFLTIDNTIETVVKAMKAGALDFIVKSVDLIQELPQKIEKVYEIHCNKIEKKQIERELWIAKDRAEASEKKFQLLFDTITEGVALNEMVFDQKGEMIDYRILEANKAFYQIGDFSSKKVIGNVATELYGMSSEMITSFWKSHKKNNETAYSEMQDPMGDRWFYVSTTPFENNTFVTVFFDITDRKKNEITIQNYTDELQKLNADKNLFIQILAHDIKSPLNSLLGYSEILSENIRQYDIEELESHINIINESIKHTLNLFEDILLWVRAQSGKLPFEIEKINLQLVCREVVESFDLSVRNKDITIKQSSTDEIILSADKSMIKTILRNLLSNAIKFTNNNGLIKIYAEQNNSLVKIIVSDNGIGIEPEIFNKLFDITANISTRGTANERGTGLGLLLCREFVEKHGGKIWAESTPGRGSDFIFTIPLKNK